MWCHVFVLHAVKTTFQSWMNDCLKVLSNISIWLWEPSLYMMRDGEVEGFQGFKFLHIWHQIHTTKTDNIFNLFISCTLIVVSQPVVTIHNILHGALSTRRNLLISNSTTMQDFAWEKDNATLIFKEISFTIQSLHQTCYAC